MTEYKNPLLDTIIEIKKGNFNPAFRNTFYPINRWMSGNDKHGNIMNFRESYYLNKYLFIVPPKMLMSYMHFSYKMHKDFRTGQPALWLRFPKKSEKEKTEKYDVIVKYLKQIYLWSTNECQKHNNVILSYIDNREFIDWLDKTCGFDKKEKKMFGLDMPKKRKFKKEEVVKKSSRSLLEF